LQQLVLCYHSHHKVETPTTDHTQPLPLSASLTLSASCIHIRMSCRLLSWWTAALN